MKHLLLVLLIGGLGKVSGQEHYGLDTTKKFIKVVTICFKDTSFVAVKGYKVVRVVHQHIHIDNSDHFGTEIPLTLMTPTFPDMSGYSEWQLDNDPTSQEEGVFYARDKKTKLANVLQSWKFNW